VERKFCWQHNKGQCAKVIHVVKKSPVKRIPIKKSPVKRIPIKSPKDITKKIYFIHNNRERPYKVIIDGHNVAIEKALSDTKYEPIFTFRIKSIFIGKSPFNEMTQSSGMYGPQYDGNSILLHIEGLKYVYVGSEIYQFTALRPIVKYISPIGNNDVPYPYAKDNNGNYYMFIYHKVVMNNPKMNRVIKYLDFVEYYYDYIYENAANSKFQKDIEGYELLDSVTI
jgi:hypothetical protein